MLKLNLRIGLLFIIVWSIHCVQIKRREGEFADLTAKTKGFIRKEYRKKIRDKGKDHLLAAFIWG
jgi:hypothetical protein